MKIFAHVREALIPGTLFSCTGLHACLQAVTTLFWQLQLYESFEIRKCETSLFSFKIVFTIRGPLRFYMNFRIFFYFHNKCHWDFYGDPVESVNHFRSHWLLKMFIYLASYFCLHWVFVAARRLSPAVASEGSSLVATHGLLIAVTSLVTEHRL